MERAPDEEFLDVLRRGTQDLEDDERRVLVEADVLVLHVAFRTAASVARTLRAADVAHRPVAARKAERDVLELAARELHLLVLHTAAVPHALDGRLPLCMETGRGLVGIEVKSGLQTIATDEVEKFRSDVAHGGFAAAIFVSLRAPIAKIPRGLHVQQELALGGLVPALFVSPLALGPEQSMTQLLRGVLALACFLTKPPPAPARAGGGDSAALGALGELLAEEAEALGAARKRFRDDEEVSSRRTDRAVDAIRGVQTRLSSAARNASLRAADSGNALA